MSEIRLLQSATSRNQDTTIKVIINELGTYGRREQSLEIRPLQFQKPGDLLTNLHNFLDIDKYFCTSQKQTSNRGTLLNSSHTNSMLDEQCSSFQKPKDQQIMTRIYTKTIQSLQKKLQVTNDLLNEQRQRCKDLFLKNEIKNRENIELVKQNQDLISFIRKVNNQADSLDVRSCSRLKMVSPRSPALSQLEMFSPLAHIQTESSVMLPEPEFSERKLPRQLDKERLWHENLGLVIKEESFSLKGQQFGLENGNRSELSFQSQQFESNKYMKDSQRASTPFTFQGEPNPSIQNNPTPRAFHAQNASTQTILYYLPQATHQTSSQTDPAQFSTTQTQTYCQAQTISTNTSYRLQSSPSRTLTHQFTVLVSPKKPLLSHHIMQLPPMNCDFEIKRKPFTTTERIFLKQVDLLLQALSVIAEQRGRGRESVAKVAETMGENMAGHTTRSLYQLHNMCKQLQPSILRIAG